MNAKTQGYVGSMFVLVGSFFVVAVMVFVLALLGVWLVAQPVQAAPIVSPGSDSAADGSLPSLETPEPVTQFPAITPEPTSVPVMVVPPEPVVAAAAGGVNVRSGPGTDYARVGGLLSGAQAMVIGRYGDWWQIEYDGAPAWVAGWVVTASNVDNVPHVEPPAPPLPVPTDPAPIPAPAVPGEIGEERWIDVNLSEQRLTAYEGSVPVHTTLVSTGLPGTSTPEGQFRIWIKLRYDDMAGADYYIEDVPFVMYFYGGYGLHGVTWHGNFGHPMSHGCVNLPTEEAEWLFNFADIGTLVNVHN